MKLFIANTTKQRHDFAFRQPETGRLVYHPINAGSQSVVLNGTRAEVDQVISQHVVYQVRRKAPSFRAGRMSKHSHKEHNIDG